MAPEALATVVNLGSAAAVVIVVVYFLRFIADQRELERDSIKDLVQEVKTLTQELVSLRKDFDTAMATMRERTESRNQRKRKVE
jgi:hypothetical protein